MTIKMSEVFELPVKKTQGGVLPFLRDSNPMCNTIFVGNDDHVDATAIAINAYDANQERIADLERAALDVFNDFDFNEVIKMSPAICNVWDFGQEVSLSKGEVK